MNNILKINKKQNITSNKIINIIKKKLKIKNIGHCGTLDSAASGLLIIFLSKKKQFIKDINKYKKIYITIILIGIKSDTNDLEGKINFFKNNQKYTNIKNINKNLLKIKNNNKQYPPIFSSIKHNSINLYKFSRIGIRIITKNREIKLHKLSLEKIKKNILILYIKCDKGVYIRSIIHELALKLKTPLCSLNIKRLSIKNFNILKSYNIKNLIKKYKS